MRALVGWFVFGGLVCWLAACSTAPAATESPTSQYQRILFENFENKNNHWTEFNKNKELGESVYVEKDQTYRIKITQSNTFLWANPLNAKLEALRDSTVSVQGKLSSDGSNNLYGVICRYQDERNFYFFVISSDGYFGIGKMIEGQYQLINRSDYPPSSAILEDYQTNRIRGECVGTRLSLYVNDQLVDQQMDADLTSGSVGLIVGSLSGATAIDFDDFEVRGP